MDKGLYMLTVALPNTLEIILMVGGVVALMAAWAQGRFNRRLHEENEARRKARKALHNHAT